MCKCNPQSLDTLQFFASESKLVIYCTKCKKPIVKKIKRERSAAKLAKEIEQINKLIEKSVHELQQSFAQKNTRKHDTVRDKLRQQIDTKLYYQQFA